MEIKLKLVTIEDYTFRPEDIAVIMPNRDKTEIRLRHYSYPLYVNMTPEQIIEAVKKIYTE